MPGQGNNAYVFPGVGLGLVVAGASECTDAMFFEAPRTLASLVSQGDLELGRLYPSCRRIREVSHAIATRVATMAFDEGLARVERPKDIVVAVREFVFAPDYVPYV